MVLRPAEPAAVLPLDEVDRQAFAERLVAEAQSAGVRLIGPGGLLADVAKRVIETGLEVEMTEHLGYAKHAADGRDGGISRNGTRTKTVITELGPIEIEVPRDRDGTFEPATVRKRQRRLEGVDAMELSLAAKGLTTGEVSAHLGDVYGASVSKDTISKITDAVLEETAGWLIRPLDRVYPVCSSTRSTSRSATARSRTGRSTARSVSPSTADATSSGSGPPRVAEERSSGSTC